LDPYIALAVRDFCASLVLFRADALFPVQRQDAKMAEPSPERDLLPPRLLMPR
jgi:hypothetical protein